MTVDSRDDLADMLSAHWLRTREGVPDNGAATVVGVCYCGIESAPQFFNWRVWHWHNLHLADAILAAVQARNAALTDTLRSVADEWLANADENERWYNGSRVSVSEAHELPALVQQAREHATAVHAILDGPGEEDG